MTPTPFHPLDNGLDPLSPGGLRPDRTGVGLSLALPLVGPDNGNRFMVPDNGTEEAR
jgi:hypothetical protein